MNTANIILLFFMGAVFTVGSIERTLKAGSGNWIMSGFYALTVSISTWYSLRTAASNDCISFAIFSAGTVFASCMIGILHSKRLKNVEK